MFDRIITDALRSADIPGDQFDAAIRAAGYKTRMDWFLRGSPASLQEAYNRRVAADKALDLPAVSR